MIHMHSSGSAREKGTLSGIKWFFMSLMLAVFLLGTGLCVWGQTASTWYRDQLPSGEARLIYQGMLDAWGSLNAESPSAAVTFQTPLSFEAELQNGAPVTKDNESYEKAAGLVDRALQAAYDAFLFDHPEVFWLKGIQRKLVYGKTASRITGSSTLYRITITGVTITGTQWYTGALSDQSGFTSAVDAAVKEVRSRIASGAARWEAARKVHYYILEKASYGTGGHMSSYTSAGVFLSRSKYRVICQGYSKAYKILCDRLGIPCILVAGQVVNVSESGNQSPEDHMWNYVNLENGKWYLVDTTRDDNSRILSDTYFLAGKNSDGYVLKVSRDHLPSGAIHPDSITFSLPALSAEAYEQGQHVWKETSRKTATCTAAGNIVFTCQDCRLTRNESLAPVPHSWETSWTVEKAATVFEEGLKSIHCANCSVVKATKTIKRLKPTAKLSKTSLTMTAGKKKTIKVSKLAAGDSVVSWTSSAPSYLTVSEKGVLKALKSTGSKKVKVTVTLASGLKKSLKVKIKPDPKVTAKLKNIPKKLTLKVGERYALQVKVLPETSKQKVRYKSSDKKIVTVTKKGILKAKKKGTAVVTVTSGTVSVSCKIKVKKSADS